MVSVKMDGYPAVGPRVGLLVATHAFWIDGNQQGNAHARVSQPHLPEPYARILAFGDSRMDG